MSLFRIDYTLPDGRKRKCYVEAVPGTPIVALLSKAGLDSTIVVRKISEVRKAA